MGIPASSTVVLSRKSTSTQAPTPVAYNNPESDEYYASYDEYSGVVAYNNSGEGTWHVTKLHLAIVEEVKCMKISYLQIEMIKRETFFETTLILVISQTTARGAVVS